MKDIFTYPNDAGTYYIDPDYVGDDTVGFQKRIKDLKDGNYKPWQGTAPVDTVNSLMENISKFNDYYNSRGDMNVTMYDFWYNPMLVGTVIMTAGNDITATVLSSDVLDPSTITTTAAHGFTTGQAVVLTGLDGSWADFNGQTLYVDVLSSNTLQIATDVGLTNKVGFGTQVSGTTDNLIYKGEMSDLIKVDLSSAPQLDENSDILFTPSYGVGKTVMNLVTYKVHSTGTPKEYYLSTTTSSVDRLTLSDIVRDVDGDSCDININHGQTTVDIVGATPATDDVLYLNTTEDGVPQNNSLFAELISGNTYKLYNDKSKTQLVTDWTDYLMTQTGHYDMTFHNDFTKHVPIFDDSLTIDLTDPTYAGYFTATLNGSFNTAEQWSQSANDYLDGFTVAQIETAMGGVIEDMTIVDSGFTLNNDILYYFTIGGQPVNIDNLNPSVATYSFQVYDCVKDVSDFPGHFGNGGNTLYYALDTSDCHTLFQDILATTPNPTGEQETLSTIYGKIGSDEYVFQILSYDSSTGRYYLAFYEDENMDEALVISLLSNNMLNSNGQLLTYDTTEELPTEDITNFIIPWFTTTGTTYFFRVPENYNYTLDAHFKIEAPDTNENRVEYSDSYNVYGTPKTGQIILPISVRAIPTGFTLNPLYNKIKSGHRVIYNNKSYVAMVFSISSSTLTYVDGTDNERKSLPSGNHKNIMLYEINTDRTADFLVDFTDYVEFTYADNTITGSQFDIMDLNCEYTVKDWQNNPMPEIPFITRNHQLLQRTDAGNISRLGATNNGHLILDHISTYVAGHNHTPATTGSLFYDDPDTFELTSLDLKIPGNEVFTYLDSNGDTQPGARLDGIYFTPTDWAYSPSGIYNEVVLNTDAAGRLSSVSLSNPVSGFSEAGDILLPIMSIYDQYVPPPTPPAELEDIFDTQDQWLDTGFAGGAKEFGKNIIPASAKITYNQPSTTNTSQAGRKYVRSAGFQRWKLNVEYRNLTKDQFQLLHADAQSARGQATPFYLVHSQWGYKVLSWTNPKSNNAPRFIEDYTAGSTLLKLGGFQSNESQVFKKGEIVIGGQSQNGGMFTALNTVDANVYGEAHVRIAYSLPGDQPTTKEVYKNPHHVIVTLDSDNFEYTVDTFGLFNVSVGFDLGAYH